MPQILGNHGIAQQFKGGPKLTNLWWLAVRGGLKVAGYRETADALPEANMRVVFYADLFRPAGNKTGVVRPYQAGAGARPARGTVCRGGGAGARNRAWGGGCDETSDAEPAAAITHPRRCGRARLIGDLKQVTAFLADPDVKERVLQRTADEVTADTTVIFGHSLGSVVAYEYVARSTPPQVELLVTVGSPLGMPHPVFDRLTPATA